MPPNLRPNPIREDVAPVRGDNAAVSKDISNTGGRRVDSPNSDRGQKHSRQSWTIEDSEKLYGIGRWSNGYLEIAENGNLSLNAPGADRTVELVEIVDGLRQRGLDMPVLLRIENLLADRVEQLNMAFRKAICDSNYCGDYRGVYPIKVNQQDHVVGEIARFGERFGHGLEAGSKAELLIAMSSVRAPNSLIICNGYKDQEFVDLGLQATRVGFDCFFVVETPGELDLILRRAEHWDVKPRLGVRLKLSARVDGHWSDDSGDRSLFGLSTRQLIELIDQLRERDLLGQLQLVHFHLGSQVPNIRNIRDGVSEACRFYIDLLNEGAPLGYLDLGGGLAVDYDGSRSTGAHSRNYDLDEYCVDVVETVMASLDPHGVPHPTLITESGRWTVAPTSMLLFNVLAVTSFDPSPIPAHPEVEWSENTLALLDTLSALKERRLQENYNDAVYFRDQMRADFNAGRIALRERAFAENVCLTVMNQIACMVQSQKRPAPELEKLERIVSRYLLWQF